MSSECTFTQPSPLDIPELLHLIASYLYKSDIALCLRVSPMWYQAFLPVLWTELDLFLDPDGYKGPLLLESRKMWPLVRKLYVDCEGNFKMSCGAIRFSNLTHLKVVQYILQHGSRSPLRNERSLVTLIKRHHSTLRDFDSNSDTSTHILQALSKCTQLEKLKLEHQYLRRMEDWMELYESLWSRLESLSFTGTFQFESTSEDIATDAMAMTTFLNKGETIIKELDLRLGGWSEQVVRSIHILLLMKSPKLIRLQLTYFDDPISTLLKIAQMAPFGQHLKELRLHGADMGNKDMQELLQRLPELERFEATNSFMSIELLRSLRTDTPQFLTTFKVLKLVAITEGSGELAQNIMTSMPCLEELVLDHITDVDIKSDGGRWICTGLKKLTIAIVLLEKGTEDMVMELVASLENLTKLNLNENYYGEVPAPVGGRMEDYEPKLSLDHGLGRLKALHRLEEFTPPEHHVQWTEREASWVLKYWVKMRNLTVNANREALDLLEQNPRIHVCW
ncbi:hypothetical protein EMPS_07135 [Entomortierella parvispora]|uniref:F-box domain-containing protein n=1 Tax=Entomortierella parvispora TaxID=205924 RepID=A0A9P3HEC1_9FUNG|nr:hypothetical protein EMPS_07135 [Entomortierella parvispora]